MSENKNKIDFLAVGDIVIDEFIKLIDKNENETFGHTVIRLAEAIGYAIDKDVLFAAVRKIRGG